MSSTLRYSVFFILSLVVLAGCGQKLPDGMPKLYSVQVELLQEGKPLADAAVSLRYPDSTAGKWAIGGRTEADGKAKLYTNGYPGTPLGNFKLCVIKQENTGLEEYNNATKNVDVNVVPRPKIKVELWSVVPLEYNDPAKTPKEVEVKADTKILTVDLGPAVKIEEKLLQSAPAQ